MEAKKAPKYRHYKPWQRDLKDWLNATPFLLPSIIIFTVFVFIPLIRSVILSTYGTNPIGQMTKFVGLKYYLRLFTSDQYLNSLFVTLKFALYTVPGVLIAGLILSTLGNLQTQG